MQKFSNRTIEYEGFVDLFRGIMEGDYTEIVGEDESSGIFKVLQSSKASGDTILKMTLSYVK